MNIILGATGHIGAAVTRALLAHDAPVTVVTRDAAKAEPSKRAGAAVAVADILDVDALRAVLARGTKAFILNPPGDPTGDAEADEHRSIASLLQALRGLDLEQIVAVSTYGAQPVTGAGDLGTLHTLEEGLRALEVPVVIQRGAYHFTNFAMNLDAIRDDGILQTMFPADLRLPMVAPADLGDHAARLLLGPAGVTGTVDVEGPARLTMNDVAAAFSSAVGRPVRVDTTPRDAWPATFKALGFSPASAASFARMTALTVDGLALPTAPITGPTTIHTWARAVAAG